MLKNLPKKFTIILSLVILAVVTSLAILPKKTNQPTSPREISSPTPTFKNLQQVSPKTFKGNLHTHTEFPHAFSSYQEIIDQAVRLKFDFIAITDHDKILGEVLQDCPKETQLLCLVGEEVSTSDGHSLAIGIKNKIPAGLSASQTIALIHNQGGIAIAAHPTAPGGFSEQTLEKLKDDLDGLECNNARNAGSMDLQFLQNFANTNNLGCVFNSDAHSKNQLSLLTSVCLMEELSFASLRNAVKSKNCYAQAS